MTSQTWLAFALAFVAALSVTAVLVPVLKRVAVRFDVLDRPGGYKSQTQPVPYLGGVAMAVATLVGVVILWRMGLAARWGEGLVIMVAAVAMMLVGLADDLWNLSPWLRLVAQAVAATAVALSGTAIELFDSELLGSTLAAVWIVGITNGLNLLDNMDGLASGVAAISGGWMFLIAVMNGQVLIASLLAGVIGAALGFLRFNYHPASIYMGDAGSLFLGFLLAVAAIRLRFDAPAEYTWVIPVLALGLPILDTSFVTFNRIRSGRNPLSGGRDHISHRLVQSGLTVRGAVSLLYGVAIAFGTLGLVVSLTADSSAYLVVGVVFGASCLGLIGLERRAVRDAVASPEPRGETT